MNTFPLMEAIFLYSSFSCLQTSTEVGTNSGAFSCFQTFSPRRMGDTNKILYAGSSFINSSRQSAIPFPITWAVAPYNILRSFVPSMIITVAKGIWIFNRQEVYLIHFFRYAVHPQIWSFFLTDLLLCIEVLRHRSFFC